MLREVIDTLHYSKIVRDRFGSSYSIDSIKAVYDEHGQNKGRLRNLFRQKAITEDQNFEIPDLNESYNIGHLSIANLE